MRRTREIIQAARETNLSDEDGVAVYPKLLPGLTEQQIDELSDSLVAPLPEEVRELLAFCSGIEGLLAGVDFTGRRLDAQSEEVLLPHGISIAADGYGNGWTVDLQPDSPEWGPIYYCCHDAPVVLVQSPNLQHFVSELFKMYTPPYKSLVDDVHEDRLFEVWRTNPGVIPHATAMASPDPEIQAFAGTLDPGFQVIDLRCAPVGMGLSWGRYGVDTELRRFGTKAIFAYKRAEKSGWFSRLFRR